MVIFFHKEVRWCGQGPGGSKIEDVEAYDFDQGRKGVFSIFLVNIMYVAGNACPGLRLFQGPREKQTKIQIYIYLFLLPTLNPMRKVLC